MLRTVSFFSIVAGLAVCAAAAEDVEGGMAGWEKSPMELKEWEWVDTTGLQYSIGMSWSSCGASSDKFQLKDLKLSPDPIKVPGALDVSVTSSLSANETALKASVKISKKEFIWVEIPCISNIGSCTYNDICPLLAKITIPDCPFGTCKCPFPAGAYNAGDLSVVLPKLPSSVPSWLGSGDYKAKIKVTEASGGAAVACINVQLSVKIATEVDTTRQLVVDEDEDGAVVAVAQRVPDALPQPVAGTDSTCDPKTFFYEVCNLTTSLGGSGCPSSMVCKKVWCPFPGQCWLPTTCNCTDKTMECSDDPTHKTECNSKECGLCEDPSGVHESSRTFRRLQGTRVALAAKPAPSSKAAHPVQVRKNVHAGRPQPHLSP